MLRRVMVWGSSALAPGVQLPGGYVLEHKIGAGGMGSVWQAHDHGLGRKVAIKFALNVADYQSPSVARRVQDEGKALAQVRHPAVVPVFAAGQDTFGRGFLVMELLRGGSLLELCHQYGAMGGDFGVEVMLHVIDGLDAAHACGIVHRDVKPSNILLAQTQVGIQPTLIDFGIASDPHIAPVHNMARTGTPDFMAPEQLDPLGDLGPGVDQWSAAVTLYYVASGRLPFAANDLSAIFERIKTAPLPFPRDDSIPPPLFAILAKATQKRPQDRFLRLSDFRQALDAWAFDDQRSPSPATHTALAHKPVSNTLDIAIRSKLNPNQ